MTPNKAAPRKYLSFSLANKEYALPLLQAREVMSLPQITKIPKSPSHLLGVTNFHGLLMSVIDLRRKLGVATSPTQESSVIVCDFESTTVGVLVDSVNDILEPEAADIAVKPQGQDKKADCVVALYRKENRSVMFLDVEKVLNFKDAI